jgi:hypothetical protein
MRFFLVSLLLIFLTSIASGEVLTSPLPIGKGSWAFSASWILDKNINDLGDDPSLTTYSGTVGYGLTEKLDVYLGYGSSSSSNIPYAEISGTGFSVAGKYILIREGEKFPISVGIAALYKSTSSITKIAAIESKASGSQTAFGIGAAKILIPFIPYLAVVYRTNSSEGSESSAQIDTTIGTMIAFSEKGAIFIEYTNQAIEDKTGSIGNYSSPQYAASIGYKI